MKLSNLRHLAFLTLIGLLPDFFEVPMYLYYFKYFALFFLIDIWLVAKKIFKPKTESN